MAYNRKGLFLGIDPDSHIDTDVVFLIFISLWSFQREHRKACVNYIGTNDYPIPKAAYLSLVLFKISAIYFHILSPSNGPDALIRMCPKQVKTLQWAFTALCLFCVDQLLFTGSYLLPHLHLNSHILLRLPLFDSLFWISLFGSALEISFPQYIPETASSLIIFGWGHSRCSVTICWKQSLKGVLLSMPAV